MSQEFLFLHTNQSENAEKILQQESIIKNRILCFKNTYTQTVKNEKLKKT